METIKLTVPPDQSPQEEAALVARVAAAVAEDTGTDTVHFQLTRSEQVKVEGVIADRIHAGARWNA
jgi:ABC-type phosphate/phosphonate transport system substrate-binding protein